ncbi:MULTISPECIES: DUF3293 domain-containing protein [unclassified Luteimonas]|uniref:DUF3293 domain-containing protein n=1 Tax=unclassified Luteimonas TaxID=2629088 RepID=UPI00160372EA|nr:MULTISPECIES: DUF3293 domain-containing protein [unclassified Luteimonas]MBB1471845.1 DUF3293 domain-containing protein [Luteimonas sp. MC1782]MBB6599424.1 DUF3293 domain-containing protein [Luteimonas sp. MC1825]QOC87128.1 DUF3293 domain-containing protein [Luteimonas sp. MC1825]
MPAPLPPDARTLSLLADAYLDAEYRWGLDGDWHDVRIGLPMPSLDLAYPAATSFGILSAWDPDSVPREDAVNRRQDAALQDMLLERGAPHLPAFASAVNRSWREPGWLVMDMAVNDFDALARRFEQLGTLWWPRGGVVRLRMYAARPAGYERQDLVDWLE